MANNNNNNKVSRLHNWHESFSLLDDVDEELFDEDDDDETGSNSKKNASRRLVQENNRSFVDFLYDGHANNNHSSNNLVNNSLEEFHPIEDVVVVRPETLSDSFIARSYPTSSMLSPVIYEDDIEGSAHHSTGTTSKKKTAATGTSSTKRKKPRRRSSQQRERKHHTNAALHSSSSLRHASASLLSHSNNGNFDSNSSLDPLIQPTRRPSPPLEEASISHIEKSHGSDVSLDANNKDTYTNGCDYGKNADNFQKSMSLSQVFNTSLQRLENTMPPPREVKEDKASKQTKRHKGGSSTTSSTRRAVKGTRPADCTVAAAATAAAAAPPPPTPPPPPGPLPETALPTTTSTTSAAAPGKSEITWSDQQLEQQRQQWQQSMKNDCLTSENNEDDIEKGTNQNNLNNTVHTSDHDDRDDNHNNGKDDTSQLSDSYHDEPPDAEDIALAKERAVRNSLLFAILSALGMMCIAKWVQKCCECFSNDSNEAADALADTANLNNVGGSGGSGGGGANNGASAGGSGGGTGNGPPSPPQQTIIQQMALKAAQNAASSTAQGSHAMANASTAEAGSGGITTAMILAGIAAAGAVTAGALVLTRGRGNESSSNVWLCNANIQPTLHQGHVVLYLEGLNDSLWLSEDDKRVQLEQAFAQVYRSVSGECRGTYQRMLESVTLHDYDLESGFGKKSYYKTNWTALVWCDGGCPEEEPLFYIRPEDYAGSIFADPNSPLQVSNFPSDNATTTSRSGSRGKKQSNEMDERNLQEKDAHNSTGSHEAWFLRTFASNFGPVVSSNVSASVLVIDGYTLSPLDGSLVERIGSLDQDDSTAMSTGTGTVGPRPVSDETDGDNSSHQSSNIFDQKHNSTSTATSSTNAEASSLCANSNDETFSYENGQVNIMIENVSSQLYDFSKSSKRELVEAQFKESYNSVSGMCEGIFQRIVHNATLFNYTFATRGDGALYVDTTWKATVSCSGCNPREPLFMSSSGTEISSNTRGRLLQMDLNTMLGKFSSHFSERLNALFQENDLDEDPAPGWQQVAVFYVASLSSDGSEVIQSTGYHPQFYIGISDGVSRPPRPTSGDSVSECLEDLISVDTNNDNMVDRQEYVRLVQKLIDQMMMDTQPLEWDVDSFESLPIDLRENFYLIAGGGSIPIFGDKYQDGVLVQQDHFLMNFCNETSLLLLSELDNSAGNEAATPTVAPTTMATTTITMATTTTPIPSSTPSTAPTSLATSTLSLTNQSSAILMPITTVAPTFSVTSSNLTAIRTSEPSTLLPTYRPTSSSTIAATTQVPTMAATTQVPTMAATTVNPTSRPTIAATTSSPTSTSPTMAATIPPTTTMPTKTPTAAPTWTSKAPSVSPAPTLSMAPTTSPTYEHELAMQYQIKFYINYEGFEDREPTDVEYEGLRVALEAFFFRYIGQQYESNPQLALINHDLAIVLAEYIPTPTEDRYTHRIVFQSDYAFDGGEPPVSEIFSFYDSMSLQQLTEEGVWPADPFRGLFYYTAGIFWSILDVDDASANGTNVTVAPMGGDA